MAFIAAPNCVKLSIENLSLGTTLVNTLWFWHPSGWDESDASTLCVEIGNWWITGPLTALSEDVEYIRTVAYDMNTEGSWVVQSTVATGTTGSLTDAQASLASAMTVTFSTNRRGRSYRGRNYIGGWTEANVGPKTFAPAAVAAMTGCYEDIPTVILGIGCLHSVVSFRVDNAPRPFGVHTPVTGYRANSRVYRMGERTK